jgi:tetratricopeptide (TPR) repeat protein
MDLNYLEKGDLVRITQKNGPSDALHQLAVNLLGIGKFTGSLDALLKEHPDWEFWIAASYWIHGDEERAVSLLQNQNTAESQTLLTQILSPQIHVVGQFSWPHSAFQDNKFRIHHIGIQRHKNLPDGRQEINITAPTKPFRRLADSLPIDVQPAFYFAQMLEWHHLPEDLASAPFPVFGAISDYDVHIQNVHPFLDSFDALITAGSEERQGVGPLTKTPIWTFPKLFHLSPDILCQPWQKQLERPYSLFISGTLDNPYHPDKTRLISEILASDLPDIHYVNGFLSFPEYCEEITKSKLALSYVRFGGINTRGLEALALGNAVLAQEHCAMPTFFGEDHGMWTYDPLRDNVPGILQQMLDQWPTLEKAAARGAQLVRDEFNQSRAISQMLRFLTVLSALPRRKKHLARFDQKRIVGQRGPSFSIPINLSQLQSNTTEWEKEALPKNDSTPTPYLNACRELDLFLSNDLVFLRKIKLDQNGAELDEAGRAKNKRVLLKLQKDLKANATKIFTEGQRKHPKCLAIWFNHLRHVFHHGDSKQVPIALAKARELANSTPEEWLLDPLHDIMPWDYHSSYFNYRDYLDHATNSLSGNAVEPGLGQKLILAALNHYVGMYTGELRYLKQATDLDPNFPYYTYHYAKTLLQKAETKEDLENCLTVIQKLATNSLMCRLILPMTLELEARLEHPLPALKRIQTLLRRIENFSESREFSSSEFDRVELILPPGKDCLPINTPRTETQKMPWPAGESGHSSLSSLHCRTQSRHEKTRIMLFPFECLNWENARQWAYNGHLAFEDGLMANGVKCQLLPAYGGMPPGHPANWVTYFNTYSAIEDYGQAWIWLPHVNYDEVFLQKLEETCPVRIAVVSESLQHSAEEESQYNKLKGRQELVLRLLRHFTHVLLFDDGDVELVRQHLPHIKALWCPAIVPWRSVKPEIQLPETKPVFHGTLYSQERQQYIKILENSGLAHQPELPENQTQLPNEYDALHEHILTNLPNADPMVRPHLLHDYLVKFRRIRRALFDKWLEGLQAGSASLNLPSIFKSYAGRVVESMAAGRPVISWKPTRERTQALFTPGREILWFDRDKPEQLAEQIRWLQANPEQAKEIAENAQRKVLRYHTAEIRMRQVLDWIADGTEPDYGEHTDLSTETKKNEIIMNEDTSKQPGTLEAFLNQAEACNENEDRDGAISALEAALKVGDRHPVLLRALGTQLYLAKQFGPARTMFAEFTAQCADDATGHVQHGLAAFHDGDEEACLACLQQALVVEPNHPEALKLLADLDVRAERYADAQAKYDQIAEQGGITSEALHALAFCQFKTGNTARAVDTYKQLLTFDAEDELATHNLAMIEKLVNETPAEPVAVETNPNPQPARETLDQAEFFQDAGNPEAALAELERAVELEPKNPQLIEALGSALFQRERFEEARRHFRHLIELQPRNAMAYTRLAVTSHATDRYDEFESALGLAMEIDPELPEMLHFMAKINLDHERYYDAGRIFSKLSELEPENIQNLLALAVCLFRGGQAEAARDTYERALQLDPENEIARTNLQAIDSGETADEPVVASETPITNDKTLRDLLKDAQAALEKGEAQRAIALLENVLSLHPNEVALLTALGNLYFHEGQPKAALEYFRRNANLQPKDVDTQLQAATTALLIEEYEPFEAFMERALELEPENTHGLKLLATANFKAKKYAEAATLYGQILPELPDDLEVILALGVCFHHLQDPATAETCFKRALEIDPYNAVAAENLKALAKANPPAKAAEPTNGHVDGETVKKIQQRVNPAADAEPANLPTAALVGNLDRAQELLAEGQHLESARETLNALEQRPFHPEAWLHLAEVALAAGDETQAKKYLETLRSLTPKWETALNALSTLKNKPALSCTEIDWPALPETPAESRLSVCLIVKDEEQSLPDALRSVRDIAHQVVVVDTGSTDRTVELATELGAEVHHFEWCDDFSAARNFALEHARGDWVLVLDADEILPPQALDDLRQDLSQGNHLGYRLPLVNKIQTDQGETETADGLCHVPRLFRNAPGLHFIGRVHEQVYSSVLLRQADWQMDSGIGTTTLHHFGYEPSVKLERGKVKRNLRLLELALAEQPPDAAMLLSYALDLFNDGQFEAALEQDREAFELLAKHDTADVLPEVRERLVSVFCYHLLQAELYEELVEIATSPMAADCGPTTSIHYVHGLALLKLDRHGEAIAPLRTCIATRDEPAFTARFKGVEGHGPHHLLADCLAKTGQGDAAATEFTRALEIAPEATSVRWSFARFHTEEGRPEKAIGLLYDAIENSSIDCRLWSLGCNVVNGHMSDAEVALHWTDCAIVECPDNPEIQKQRGVALLTVGRFEEALKFFEQAPSHPLNEGARILCQIAAGQKARLGDPDKELLISKAFVEWYRRLLERGQGETAQRLAEQQLGTIDAVLPTAAQVLREAAVVED